MTEWVAMKKTLLACMLLVTAPAFAGTPVSSKAPMAPPPPAPCLFTWFAGGSVGYLTEFEEAMYHAHFGTDTCWNVGGWDIALFGEIGYTRKSESFSPPPTSVAPQTFTMVPDPTSINASVSGLDGVFQSLANYYYMNTSYKMRIVPITANIKFERAIAQQLGVYIGAGLGVANIDFSANYGSSSISDDDWVFVAQAFAGLVYNVNQSFEVYGGARYMYFRNPSFSSGGNSVKLKMDDDYLFELGARFNF